MNNDTKRPLAFLENLVGKDGVKTDIKVSLDEKTIIQAAVYFTAAGAVVTLFAFSVKAISNLLTNN